MRSSSPARVTHLEQPCTNTATRGRLTVKMLHKFRNMISRGERVPDPSEPVELVVVSGASGPMTVARLREEGFDAAGYETNAGTGLACEYRIFIPRGQREQATALLKSIL